MTNHIAGMSQLKEFYDYLTLHRRIFSFTLPFKCGVIKAFSKFTGVNSSFSEYTRINSAYSDRSHAIGKLYMHRFVWSHDNGGLINYNYIYKYLIESWNISVLLTERTSSSMGKMRLRGVMRVAQHKICKMSVS